MFSLIFLHGNSSSSKEWEKVVKILSNSYRCYNWNLFGHDGHQSILEPSLSSQATFLNERIEKEIKNDYILIGHSLGGHVAIQMAAQKLPKALITIGTLETQSRS